MDKEDIKFIGQAIALTAVFILFSYGFIALGQLGTGGM